MTTSSLYQNIRRIREERGMSQDELAKLVGFKSRSSINKIELGVNDITQSKIVAIANALHVSPATLMGEDNSKTEQTETSSADLLDFLFHDEPEFLARVRSIDIEGKIRQPNVVYNLDERQKDRIKDIIRLTLNEAEMNAEKCCTAVIKSKAGVQNANT